MVTIFLGIFLSIVLTGAVGMVVLFLACDAAAEHDKATRKPK